MEVERSHTAKPWRELGLDSRLGSIKDAIAEHGLKLYKIVAKVGAGFILFVVLHIIFGCRDSDSLLSPC